MLVLKIRKNACSICRLSRFEKNPIPFFAFPEDKFMQQRWRIALTISAEFELHKHFKVCGRHFLPSMFVRLGSDVERFRLNANAFPMLLKKRDWNLMFEHHNRIRKSSKSIPFPVTTAPAVKAQRRLTPSTTYNKYCREFRMENDAPLDAVDVDVDEFSVDSENAAKVHKSFIMSCGVVESESGVHKMRLPPIDTPRSQLISDTSESKYPLLDSQAYHLVNRTCLCQLITSCPRIGCSSQIPRRHIRLTQSKYQLHVSWTCAIGHFGEWYACSSPEPEVVNLGSRKTRH